MSFITTYFDIQGDVSSLKVGEECHLIVDFLKQIVEELC